MLIRFVGVCQFVEQGEENRVADFIQNGLLNIAGFVGEILRQKCQRGDIQPVVEIQE